MKDITHKITQGCFKHLIGIPYETLNCWDLVKKFYSDCLKLDLKHYYEDPKVSEDRPAIRGLIFSNCGDFDKVEGFPEIGDILIIKVHGIESHIAVYVGTGLILHTLKRIGSHLDRKDKWDKVISGIYRHRAQEQ